MNLEFAEDAGGERPAESSRRRRCRARRPTPAGFPYWGRSKAPFCLSKVCSPRPRRASSAPPSTSGRPPRWERRLRARAAAAGALGGPRPRAPAIGGDLRRHSARARRAICARAAPTAPLKAARGALLAGSVAPPPPLSPWWFRVTPVAPKWAETYTISQVLAVNASHLEPGRAPESLQMVL